MAKDPESIKTLESYKENVLKPTKINLKLEYDFHLYCMGFLNILEPLKTGLDHSYFKNVVCSFIDEK